MRFGREEAIKRTREFGYIQLHNGSGFQVTLDALGHLDRAIKSELICAKEESRETYSLPVRLELVVNDYVTIFTDDVAWYVETDYDSEYRNHELHMVRDEVLNEINEERKNSNPNPHIPGVSGYE